MCSQRSSKQRIRLNLPISASVLSPFQRFIPISAFYPHFSVLSPFQRFIPISAFYPHFSVLSPFQRFIPISAFYPHFSVLSPFQFPLSVSVSAIQFQRFIPTRCQVQLCKNPNESSKNPKIPCFFTKNPKTTFIPRPLTSEPISP